MLLNDNEYSLQTIQEKTNITIENLEKIRDKEWSHFKKPQINGLLSIIEREFGVDLSDLREEANTYFKEHQDKEPDRPIDLVDAATIGGGSGIMSNIITIVSLCAVGYAGWYYFVESKKQNIIVDSNETVYEKKSGMFNDTINSAKSILGNSNDKKEPSKKKEEINQEQVSQNRQVLDNSTKETAKEEVKKFDITTVKKEEVSSDKEDNESRVVISGNNTTDTKSENTETNNSESNSSKTKSEADTLLNELDTNVSSADSIEYNNTSDINSSVSTLDDNTSKTIITEATFKVKSKRLWMGIYNLTKHKRVSETIKKPFTLNIGEDKFAIVTGHNAFEIVTDNGVKRFAKKGKVYFTIDKDGIKQLDRREYRKLTKKRAW